MGALDWVASAGIPIVSGIADTITGNANAQQARDAFKSRYQDTVKDLKKAGLNPSLAYGQGGGNPQTHDRPLPGEQIAKSAQGINSAAQARATAELTAAQASLLKAQAADLIQNVKLKNDLLGAQVGETGARKRLAESQVGLTTAQTAESSMRTQHLGWQIEETKERISLIKAQTNLTATEARKAEEVMRQIRQDVRWRNATWDVQMSILQRQLEQAGVNIELSRLEKVARDLGLSEKRAEKSFYEDMGKYGSTGANQVMRTLLMLLKGNQ